VARLTALVIGTGYAGQGHALALRDAGVEIVALAGRTEAVLQRVGQQLGVARLFTDWRSALAETRPDIVAVSTTAGPHVEMISAALGAGCHVFTDKPLAPTAADAKLLYERARRAGLKTAYAASYRYQPQALFARRLVGEGFLGAVEEVECVSHFGWPRRSAFGWPHRLDEGGGRLNNNFPHKLSIVLNVLSGRVAEATGESRNDLQRVPAGERLHDFRNFTRSALTPEAAAMAEWRDVDSDWAYTALCRVVSPHAPSRPVSAVFRHSALHPSRTADYMAFYGDQGALHLEGAYATGAVFLHTGGEWRELPVPEDIREALPAIEDDTQRNWTQLAREFTADLRGEGEASYLTFRDGWLFQEIIEGVRRGDGWFRTPEEGEGACDAW